MTSEPQQIQIVIEDQNPNQIARPPATSTPNTNESHVTLGLVVDDIQSDITIKNESNEAVDRDISQIAKNLDLNINDSDDENDLNIDVDSGNDKEDGEQQLSDEQVMNLPIQYLKRADLECRKKLLHCQRQACYLDNLVKKKGKKYVICF